jgi:Immunity protein family (Imm11)
MSQNASPDNGVMYCQMSYRPVKGACSVTFISNQQFCWAISVGDRVAAEWPADVVFQMNPENTTNVALVDYISNQEGMLLASPRLRDFFRDQALPDLEFLKVAILDHKGRVAADDYSVVNCCRVVDCVDQKSSQFEWDGLDNPSMEMERMVINPAAVTADDRMIRPRYVPALVLYRMDLVEAIRGGKFTGVGFRRTVFGDDEKY